MKGGINMSKKELENVVEESIKVEKSTDTVENMFKFEVIQEALSELSEIACKVPVPRPR